MMFGGVSEHFTNLRHVTMYKTYVSGMNALFRGTEVVKHSFYFIGTKMMFGSVSEYFANLRHVKRYKTCVSGPNALFWCTEVVKHSFYSIGTKMMFGGVAEHFANLRHVTKVQNLCFGSECIISGYRSCKAFILLHWNQNDVWGCFRAFH
jgi:hypothetical protein